MAKKPMKSAPKRGRPAVGATLILIRLRPNELAKLDSARKSHGGDLSRPEAIRRVVEKMSADALS